MLKSVATGKGSTSQASRADDCFFAFGNNGALAFTWPDEDSSNEKVRVIGGMKIGYPDNHHARFFLGTGKKNLPHVGIRLYFPSKEVDYVSFRDTNGLITAHTVVIKLKAGDFASRARELTPEDTARLPSLAAGTKSDIGLSVVQFRLKSGKVAEVEKYKMPTVCESTEDQAIMDDGAVIDGVMSIRELCLQNTFEVVIPRYSSRLASPNNQFRDILGDDIAPVYPYTNGYLLLSVDHLRP